jgi:hypothetical protein|tara:strand:- start:303 stop:548 length:246 start_codon:yes stop_codon:yes gene_type:complete
LPLLERWSVVHLLAFDCERTASDGFLGEALVHLDAERGAQTLMLQLERFERRDKKLVASSGAKVAGYVAGYVELEIEIVRN